MGTAFVLTSTLLYVSLVPGSPARKIKGGRGRESLVHFDHVRDVVCTFAVDFAHARARGSVLRIVVGLQDNLIKLAFISSVLLHPEDSGRLTMMARLQEGKIEWLVNVAIVCFISSPLRDVLLLETCPCSLTVTLCLFI